MKKFKALKAVYSYMFPEVQQAIWEALHPEMVSSFDAHGGFNGFLNNFFKSPNEMDTMHEPILQKWVDKHYYVKGMKDYKFRYPTAGSEEGIREFMTHLANMGVNKFFVLNGEYEGYKFVARTRTSSEACFGIHGKPLQMDAIEISPEKALTIGTVGGDGLYPCNWFFISNPSARDGNIIPNKFIRALCDHGVKIFYDLAYVDSTRYHEFDLSHPNIKAVVMSFSKPYGLFYWRVGALFSRDEEIPGLVGNKWFKVVALLVADHIMDTIDPIQLARKYRKIQKEIVDQLREEYDLPFQCSDAVILAHIKDKDMASSLFSTKQKKIIAPFRRGNGYRFCLKPYFEEWEKKQG